VDQAKVAQALINLKDVPTLEGLMHFSATNTSQGVTGGFVEWQVKGGQYTDPKIIN
jgi:hypothetical protein